MARNYKRSIRKRSAALYIAKDYYNAPEYLLAHIMEYWPSSQYAKLTKMMVPMLQKLKAKHLQNIINESRFVDDQIHVKTT